MGKYTNLLNDRINATNKTYRRDLFQTFLTAPEWRNVEMSEEFASFLSRGNPFYRFPYFKEIAEFWRIFYKAYKSARKYNSRSEVILSDYMVMSLFIGIFSTVEYLTKGLYSLFLWPFLPKKNNTVFQQHVAKLFSEYASFIHKIPFYNYNYFSKVKTLARDFWNSESKSIIDFVTFLFVFFDFSARGIISLPIAYFYSKEANQEAKKISLIVKNSTHAQVDPERFQEDFVNQIKKIVLDDQDSEINPIEIVSQHNQEQVYSRKSHTPEKQHVYAHIQVPRYEAFQKVIEKLVEEKIKVVKIAGQERIQIKCTTNISDSEELTSLVSSIKNKSDCDFLYKYKNILLFNVPTKSISKFINTMDEMKEKATVKFIHDF